ncbi:MAG: hypothetical protein J6D03_02850 [Clostridia bacterium]|nr:hypothetical protein [Clostridia bacterium]
MRFTKSNLQDGDRCTLRNGDIAINRKWYANEDYNEDLTNKNNREKDVVKVERATKYTTVFERKKEILDNKERKWIRHFTQSTNIKIKTIRKMLGASCVNEYLVIDYSNYYTDQDRLFLPIFKKGTMYTGMEKNKDYTPEELGI